MSREKRLTAGISLLGTGASVLGFGATEQQLSALQLPHLVYATSLYAGALLFLGGVVLTAVSWEIPAVRPEVTYEFRRIRRNELRAQLRLVKGLLGEAPPLRMVKDIHNINPNSIRLAEKVAAYRSGKKVVDTVGFFSILPLAQSAVALLEEERLDGLRFNAEHICTPKQKAAGLYIGSIAARGIRARGQILGYVRSRIDEAADSGIRLVFTRPISRDGLRLAKQYGFQPVADDCGDDELRRIYRREYKPEPADPADDAPNPGPQADG